MSTSRRRVRPECDTQAGHTTTNRGCAETSDIAGASAPDDPTCQLAAEKMLHVRHMVPCLGAAPRSLPSRSLVSWSGSCATGTRRTRAGEAADHVAYELRVLSRPAAPQATSRAPSATVEPKSTYPPTHGTGDTSGGSAGSQQTAGGASRPRPAELGTARSIPGEALAVRATRLPGQLGTTRLDALHACIPSHVERDPGRERVKIHSCY